MALESWCRERGAHSIAVSWTKGHVTLKALQDRTHSSHSAISNSVADLAAGRGFEAGYGVTRDLLAYYAGKQRIYIDLIRAISDRISRVAQHVAERRRAKTATANIVNIQTPSAPDHPPGECSTRIVVIDPPPVSGDLACIQRQMQLRAFWSLIKLMPII